MSRQSLIDYTLQLADTALILAQRNGEWCGHGPVLEQDIAITNITLDLVGQARSLYQYAANLINEEGPEQATEDSLAYLRQEREYRNLLLAELPRGDWGQTLLRQFFISAYQLYLYQSLQEKEDKTLAAIAEKSVREVSYHLRWSSEWVIRLGDGTEESRQRMIQALDELWPYTGEMFMPSPAEKELGIGLDQIKNNWDQKVAAVFQEAGLTVPKGIFMQTGGKSGLHTEHLGYILSELQYMQRVYPGCEW